MNKEELTPRQIALLLTEDISQDNGLLSEDTQTETTVLEAKIQDWEVQGNYGQDIKKEIPIEQIKDASEFPYIADKIALPTFNIPKQIKIETLYALLKEQAKKTGNKLIVVGRNGIMFPDKSTYPWELQPRPNREMVDTPVLVYAIYDGKKMTGISTFIRLSRQRRLTSKQNQLDPQEWANAIERNYASISIADRLPMIFSDYYGIENGDAQPPMVMLASAKYGEGLYIVPMRLTIDDEDLDWVDAVERFSENPQNYINVEIPETTIDRIRLLFRKWMEQTDQGRYVERRSLNPDDTIVLFAASRSLEDFEGSYQTQSEDVERLERILSDSVVLTEPEELQESEEPVIKKYTFFINCGSGWTQWDAMLAESRGEAERRFKESYPFEKKFRVEESEIE